MSKLDALKKATSLKEVAHIVGFRPKALAYILYKKNPEAKYHQFEIPKKSGGNRTIHAPSPDLMKLQKRLSSLLQDCIDEIDKASGIQSTLSHGFKRNRSIMTNASAHRKKRYLFNVDLEDFFGAINFGRVRGFFISNRNFELHPAVATVLAQVICYNNKLPQGSPCSPVISNLIGHVLDIKLARLAYKNGCHYSRYVDDLTFSTNKSVFPSALAEIVEEEPYKWRVGKELIRIIEKSGFSINAKKVRMQLKTSRQDVTGLVVNNKVNTKIEYRRIARAMTHQLCKTGNFKIKETVIVDGVETNQMVDGSNEQLNGILNFISTVSNYETKKRQDKKNKNSSEFSSMEATYRRFLVYKDFYTSPIPIILCEGKTDNIYIKAAIRQLAEKYPLLAEKKDDDSIHLKVKICKYTDTTGRVLDLSGGTGDLSKLMRMYKRECERISAPGKLYPCIFIVDNDEGAKGKGGIYKAIKEVTGTSPDGTENFYHAHNNLYVIPTPLTADGEDTMIEDFFETKVKDIKIRGKKFNPCSKGFDKNTEYGKYIFAEQVIKKNALQINFSGFMPILDRIVEVIDVHVGRR